MRHPGARMARLVGSGFALLVAIGTVTACTGADDNNGSDKGGETMNTTTDGLVCGLVDVALVQRVTGDAEIGTRGRGISDKASRALEPADCTVQNLDFHQTVLQVLVGEVPDPVRSQNKLKAEAERIPGVARYTGDPGVGYGRTYESGVFVSGASVYVVRGERMIRVTVHHWADATPDERLALAEEMVLDIDKNVTAYDAEHGG